jgi:hypothetical protein
MGLLVTLSFIHGRITVVTFVVMVQILHLFSFKLAYPRSQICPSCDMDLFQLHSQFLELLVALVC